jgi:hypothetical protein
MCVYVYVYIYVYIYMNIYLYIHIHMYMYMYVMYMYMYVYIYMCICMCICVCVYVCTWKACRGGYLFGGGGNSTRGAVGHAAHAAPYSASKGRGTKKWPIFLGRASKVAPFWDSSGEGWGSHWVLNPLPSPNHCCGRPSKCGSEPQKVWSGMGKDGGQAHCICAGF